MNNIDVCTESKIKELATALNTCQYQIAELSRIKEALEDKLCNILQHPGEGQKTYTHGQYDITVSTGYNYTLDKDEYQILCNQFKDCFNPVTTRIAYDISKAIIRDTETYGSMEDIALLAKVVSKKPKKLSVKIKAGL